MTCPKEVNTLNKKLRKEQGRGADLMKLDESSPYYDFYLKMYDLEVSKVMTSSELKMTRKVLFYTQRIKTHRERYDIRFLESLYYAEKDDEIQAFLDADGFMPIPKVEKNRKSASPPRFPRVEKKVPLIV